MALVRALLLTDVVDSTRLAQQLGDEAAAALWAAHDRAARALLPAHRGREIDKTDGLLLLFEQAADALAYAGAYHAALQQLQPPLEARAGLHVGPVLLRENAADDVARGAKPLEVDGIAKPTVARVMALARGGQTLLTADAARALPGLALHAHGHWRLKGVAEPVELFEAGAVPLPAPEDGDKAHRVARRGERWLPLRQLPNNLPQQATSFLGREGEIDELKALLGTAHLVTLLGMGGLGKTRLSLQVAAEVLADFPDGAWFLDLSALREPARVVEEAARLFEVKEEPGRPLLQTLAGWLAGRRLLLVIDNCEHLVEAAAALAHAVLRAARDVRLLASSREALRVPGEQVYPVRPLPLPAAVADAAAVGASAAVRLFVERARAHRPDFVLDAEQAPQVAALVARLEGIPLAIELAAARVRSLAVRDINARLDDRYRLLTGGSRALQERQQTLRALVDWSYDLLRPDEQTLLQRLGVFVGGFALASAEAVCGVDPLDPLDVVDLLDSLVEKSLVMPDVQRDETRYRLLETLREYAAGKLAAAGAAKAFGERHAAHFFECAKRVRDGLRGAAQAQWAQRGEADLDNFRAAMSFARSGGSEPLLAAQLAVALQNLWILRGRLREGREWIAAALALPVVQASDVGRAHTLYVGAALAFVQGDAADAQRQLETCLALRRGLGDEVGVASALSTLARVRLALGQAEAALAEEQEALALFRRLGERLGESVALVDIGHVMAYLGRWAEAGDAARQALHIALELDNPEVQGDCHGVLSDAAEALGDAAAAHEHRQHWLRCCRDGGDRSGEAQALAAQGREALGRGDLDAAGALLGQALAALREFDLRADVIVALEDHAALAWRLGDAAAGVRLLAAAAHSRDATGLAPSFVQLQRIEACASAIRERLAADAFDAGWADGSAWTLATASDVALALLR